MKRKYSNKYLLGCKQSAEKAPVKSVKSSKRLLSAMIAAMMISSISGYSAPAKGKE